MLLLEAPQCCHDSREANCPSHHNINYLRGGRGDRVFKERNNKNWLVGSALKEIHRKREHNELVRKANILRASIKEIKERSHIAQHLETCGGEDVEAEDGFHLGPRLSTRNIQKVLVEPNNLLICLYCKYFSFYCHNSEQACKIVEYQWSKIFFKLWVLDMSYFCI